MVLKVILNDFKNKGFFNYILNVKRGLRIQINVLRALIYREFIGRASLVKFGYLGILIEPLGIMAIFLTIFTLIRRRGGNEDLGVLLFLILNTIIFTKKYQTGACSYIFLIFYGIFRIFSELFREPDPQVGYLLNYFSMGTLLSFFMIVAGFIIYNFKKNEI